MARILIVDDDAEIRRLISTILVDEGHKIVSAPDGEKALEMLAVEAPDLMVLDIMMPKMDGYGVLKGMRAAGMRESTKVLILTARTSEADWVRGYKLGADHYLTKPFDVNELVETVENLLSMSKDQLRSRREEELSRAQLLSRLESIFQS